MARVVLANAFSLGMLPQGFSGELHVRRNVPLDEVRNLVGSADEVLSVVGHPGTAAVLSELLGMQVQTNRVQYTLKPSDVLVVFQLGVRLQEGQVLSKEEVQNLLAQGKVSFDLVWM
jgi:hypothetical protein